MTEDAPAKKRYWIPSDRMIKLITRAHVSLYRPTGGRIARNLRGHEGILVTTVGRRSGKRHTVCLPILPDGDDMIVVASFAGNPRHPAWYVNLAAAGHATVHRGRRRFEADATTITGPERAEVWQRLLAVAPWYEDYQAKTEREIPLVRLTPRATAAAH